MALCITNSLLRTSFQIRSPLPPLISLPTTTTIRTVFSVKSIDPEKSEKAQHEEYPYEIDYKSRGTTKEKSKSWWYRIKNNKFVSKANFLLRPRIDPGQLQSMIQNLKPSPPNVFVEEACKLEDRLGEAAMGNAFLLQAGDRIDGSSKELNDDNSKVILQMSTILMFRAQMPIIKVGNQFSKPRSQTFEDKDGVKLDNLNGDAFDPKLSTSHPQRLIKPYCWNLDFMENSEYGDRYRELASQVEESLRLMLATGHTVDHPTDFWTSHEYLPNDQRSLITRKDSTSSLSYDCSSHFLLVGERTCQLDGPHVKFLKRIANPLGIKVSEKMDPKELVKLIGILNPKNKPGRITIITRMGAENIKLKLPNIVREVKRVRQIVTWVTDPDPMPRNTIKPHPFDAIRAEVRAFFDVHEQEGSYPGGVHLEMTGQNKTEVSSGTRNTTFDNTHSDSSLNASQALELAFIIAERLQKQRITTQPTN